MGQYLIKADKHESKYACVKEDAICRNMFMQEQLQQEFGKLQREKWVDDNKWEQSNISGD